MTQAELYGELTRIYHQVLERSDLALTSDVMMAQLPGWNSFKYVDLILEVEDRFAIKLESDDVDDLETVGDLARVIEAKWGARA